MIMIKGLTKPIIINALYRFYHYNDNYMKYDDYNNHPDYHYYYHYIKSQYRNMKCLSLAQLEEFRKLLGDDGQHHIVDNFRPVQHLNGRTVSYKGKGEEMIC